MILLKPFMNAIKLITSSMTNHQDSIYTIYPVDCLRIIEHVEDTLIDLIESQLESQYYRFFKPIANTIASIDYFKNFMYIEKIKVTNNIGKRSNKNFKKHIEYSWSIVEEDVRVISSTDKNSIIEVRFFNHDQYFLSLGMIEELQYTNENNSYYGNFNDILPEEEDILVMYRVIIEIKYNYIGDDIVPLIIIKEIETM